MIIPVLGDINLQPQIRFTEAVTTNIKYYY